MSNKVNRRLRSNVLALGVVALLAASAFLGGGLLGRNPQAQNAGRGGTPGQGAAGPGRRERIENHKAFPRVGTLSATGALSGNR